MRPQLILGSALLVVIGMATAVGAARARQRRHVQPVRDRTASTVAVPTAADSPRSESAPTAQPSRAPDPFECLPRVTFVNRSSKESLAVRLYAQSGAIDGFAAEQLDMLLADARDPKQPRTTQIDRRLLQLLYRTAYHFEASRIEVTSAYRMQGRRREGLHALGRAIDFAIPDVKPTDLASYLRRLPRVGVGIYTHPRTRFVHLDVRSQSYHWLDASPPGRSWRGMSIGDKSIAIRDAAYRRESDWPEGLPAPKSE